MSSGMRGRQVTVPGKVTLLGEHAVVYGYPAVVMAINLYTRAAVSDGEGAVKIESSYPGGRVETRIGLDGQGGDELPYVKAAIKKVWEMQGIRRPANIRITSDLPYGSGLGSSASVSIASLAAYSLSYGVRLQREQLAKLGREIEVQVQGRASPMDTLAVSLGGLIKVVPPDQFERIGEELAVEAVIACVGKEKNTAESVAFVRRRKEELGHRFEEILEEIGSLVESSSKAIKDRDLTQLCTLMNRDEELLEELGVVTERSLNLVRRARALGALGAKISGGGFGGCVVALGGDEKLARGLAAIADRVFIVSKSQGVSYARGAI
ncbi:mevalonate kinase [Tardisphaera miroshnichenkoae]